MLPLLVFSLVAQGVGEPLCPRRVVSKAACGLEAHDSHPWSTAYVYHASVAVASLTGKQVFEDLLPSEPCTSTVSLQSTRSKQDYPSRFFAKVKLPDPTWSSWASTPDGEWTALASDDSPRMKARLQLSPSASCHLAGASVYRPAPGRLVLRLNFDDCGDAAGVKHAAVEISVQRTGGQGGGSKLLEWMCALMDPEACSPPSPPTELPAARGRRLVDGHQSFLSIGPGQCASQGLRRAERRASARTLQSCAEACIVGGTGDPQLAAGKPCQGFAFSEDRHPHCLLYSNLSTSRNAQQLTALDGWGCFAVSSMAGAPRDPVPLRALHTASVALDLHSELGQASLSGVSRRLVPLAKGCYEPFEWIVLDRASRVALGESDWDAIERRLPVVAAPARAMQSELSARRVCVRLGRDTGAGRGGDEEGDRCSSRVSPPGGAQIFRLFLAGLLTAVAAAAVTVFAMDRRLQNRLGVDDAVRARISEGYEQMSKRVSEALAGAKDDQGGQSGEGKTEEPSVSRDPLLETSDEADQDSAAAEAARHEQIEELRSMLKSANEQQSQPRRPAFSSALNAALVPADLMSQAVAPRTSS